ncbi:MAG TPA: hypothetical protein VJ729_06410 [Nitrososphaeraceae archaeon]|nr:hypothetical protein [Nitrososphaeraceae archaeon]
MQISHYMAEYLAAMSFKGNRIDRLYEQIRSTVDHINQDEDVGIKVVVDTDPGIIRIYDQETDSLKRATSSLYDLLELSYSTAEHHPYWSLLYNATEILKTILDKWLADFSIDEIDDMSWRINQLGIALRKFESI